MGCTGHVRTDRMSIPTVRCYLVLTWMIKVWVYLSDPVKRIHRVQMRRWKPPTFRDPYDKARHAVP